VADAGGNALLEVSASGRVSTVAVLPDLPVDLPFPGFPMDALPTAVTKDRTERSTSHS